MELIDDWADWMNTAGLSNRTIKERVSLVRRFESEHGDATTADWRAIAAFFRGRDWKAGTRQTHFAHLRAWYRWMVIMDHRLDDPMAKLKAPKRPRRTPRPVTLEQLDLLLRTRMHRRTFVMVLLAAFAGLRVSEIARVRGQDLRFGSIVVLGKGGVEAQIPLHPVLQAVAATMPRTGYWFPSHTRPGKPIRGQSVTQMISNLMHRAGVPGTPHCLRHFTGTEALRASGNLAVVQQILRHAHMSTTVIYTEVDDTERRAAIEGLPVPPAISGCTGSLGADLPDAA